jgi:TolB protein
MSRPVSWGIAIAIVAVSCTGGAEDGSTTSASESPIDTSATAPSREQPGRLAIVDGDGQIVVVDPDGSNLLPVTDGGDDLAVHMQPNWSPDGTTLAWGQATGAGFGVAISQPGSGDITALTTPNLPFYTYWSPDGRHLGILHNGTTGVQFQIVDVAEETLSPLDEDAPFYFSWSPEGDRVVTHAGTSRFETLQTDGGREELAPTAGSYLAPQWTPNGVFHVVDDRLVVEDDSGDRTPVAVVPGEVTMFVANPEGSMVALQSTGGGPGAITASTEDPPMVSGDTVVVVEVSSGDIETVDDGPAVGFFWSSNGERLLVLSAGRDRITPMVWSGDGGSTSYPGFTPSSSLLRDTLPFFPQYAQSVSFWAPHSSAFAFAGAVGDEAGVWVQELDAEGPQRVSDGTWVAWSAAAS